MNIIVQLLNGYGNTQGTRQAFFLLFGFTHCKKYLTKLEQIETWRKKKKDVDLFYFFLFSFGNCNNILLKKQKK